jgi:hypothetical protein
MKKRLLTTIAGAALIAGCGLALAQTMESSPGGAAREHQPSAMQGQAPGRSGAIDKDRSSQSGAMESQTRGQRSTQSDTMQGQAQEPSGAAKGKEHRSGPSGAMQGQAQEPSGAAKGKEHRSGPSGAAKGKEHRSTPPGMQNPAQEQSGAAEDKANRSDQSGAMQSPAQGRTSAGSAALSSDQTTRIRQTVANGNIHRVNHVNFSLSVGTRVPHNVTFYDVPETIVNIVPQYRGFKYVAVRDDFAIIDPGTREIVALVPMHGSAVGQSGRSVGSTTLSADQRTRLHRVITGGDIRRIDNADFALSVGTRVPNTVTFYDLPETIVDIVPEYRGDEYIVVGDQLVIIDPETLEILAVL